MTAMFIFILGLAFAFILQANISLMRVSKGLNMYQLYFLSIADPIEDDILRYSFFNIFMARLHLMLSLLFILLMVGVVLWLKYIPVIMQ